MPNIIMSVEPRSPVERDIIEMSLESVKKGGNQHIVRKDDDDEKLGLLNIRAFFFLILWYIFSAFTLFLNKYILTTLKGDPAVLGTFFPLTYTFLVLLFVCKFYMIWPCQLKPFKIRYCPFWFLVASYMIFYLLGDLITNFYFFVIHLPGAMQMVMTTICGFIQLYIPMGFYKPVKRDGKPPNFWRNMILVGSMRYDYMLL